PLQAPGLLTVSVSTIASHLPVASSTSISTSLVDDTLCLLVSGNVTIFHCISNGATNNHTFESIDVISELIPLKENSSVCFAAREGPNEIISCYSFIGQFFTLQNETMSYNDTQSHFFSSQNRLHSIF